MDRENGTRSRECVFRLIELPQVSGDQCSLVIVTVKNIRRRRYVLEEFHHGALKKNPSIPFVRIPVTGCRIEVDPGPVKEAVIAEEENTDGRARQLCAVNIVGNIFETD